MQENFTVSIPHIDIFQYRTFFISLILAFLIIYPLGIQSIPSILSFIVLTLIIYLFIKSMAQENKSDALPFTTFPTPPHTGLDGIDVDNLVAGVPVSQIIQL